MNTNANFPDRLQSVTKAYLIAKHFVIKKGFASEIDWQYQVSLGNVDESTFLRETAWVVLNSGMRESVVRNKFLSISQAFLNWKSATSIINNKQQCRRNALHYFRHEKKVDAIIQAAAIVQCLGFPSVLNRLRTEGEQFLEIFPYIGPVTSLHLAKNLGLPLAKPDRHLSSIAEGLGYECVQRLCSDVADRTDDPIPVVDIVLWRYATLRKKDISRFSRYITHR